MREARDLRRNDAGEKTFRLVLSVDGATLQSVDEGGNLSPGLLRVLSSGRRIFARSLLRFVEPSGGIIAELAYESGQLRPVVLDNLFARCLECLHEAVDGVASLLVRPLSNLR